MASVKINVAVAGLGFMGVTHLRAWQQIKGARIVAVCGKSRLPVNGVIAGVDGNIQKSAGLDLGRELKVYRDFSEMLADPQIDVVDICTPTSFHAAQSIAALKAGKHVLCEKPLAQSSAEAKAVERASAAAKTILMPAMCMRFWPGWAWLKEMVATQKYGKVLAADFRRYSVKPAWGAATSHFGGALFDFHIHDTDFVHHLFGMPQSVYSTGVCDSKGVVEHVVTQYGFANGPVVHAEASWLLAQGFNMGYTLNCEQATVDFDFSRGQNALQISSRSGKIRTVKLAAHDGYTAEIRHFMDCVLNRRKPAVATALDSLATLKICEAEEKSLRAGKVVQL